MKFKRRQKRDKDSEALTETDYDSDDEEAGNKTAQSNKNILSTAGIMAGAVGTLGVNILAGILYAAPLNVAACVSGSIAASSVAVSEPFLSDVNSK